MKRGETFSNHLSPGQFPFDPYDRRYMCNVVILTYVQGEIKPLPIPPCTWWYDEFYAEIDCDNPSVRRPSAGIYFDL